MLDILQSSNSARRSTQWLIFLSLGIVLVAGGCGDENFNPAHHQASPEGVETNLQEDATHSDDPHGDHPASSQVDSNQLTIAVSSTFVSLPDIAHLSWAANSIVLGTVTGESEPRYVRDDDPRRDPETPNPDPGAIFTDYVIQVSETYRGAARDTLHIRRQGGTIGNITVLNMSEPDLMVGDQAVFFLVSVPEPDRGDVLVFAGGPQGVWWLLGDEVVPANSDGHVEPTPLSVLKEEIATALNVPPPAGLGGYHASLEAAPPGPDLPD